MQLAIQTLPEKNVIQLWPSYKITIPYVLPKMISGTRQKFIKWLMWNNIVIVALKKIRNQFRNQRPPVKYSCANSALGSIALFIASAKNKRKANTAIAFFKMETIPVIQQYSFVQHSNRAV